MARACRRHTRPVVLARSTYLSTLVSAGNELATRAEGNLGVAVPMCPEWTIGDLVWHVTQVHSFWNQIAQTGLAGPENVTRYEAPDDGELLSVYAAGIATLAYTLEHAHDSDACWTWAGPRDSAWIIRRMAHETAVHAWDAANAFGNPVPLNTELASDGIDEFVHVMIPHAAKNTEALHGSVHIHCTDVAGEWLVVPQPGGELLVTREHAKGDCAIRGTASDINVSLWRRLPQSSLEVIGNADVAAQFLGIANND
ncbi:MAG: maleylpyruvate isomerase family mycothiol-dependent enzyme [Actinobacteria bacterium]|nr:maleylpyruvate isomerase family mycothiol-dependent enzyme [Actinomycetota bacterium]